jgi:hypothetical protein
VCNKRIKGIRYKCDVCVIYDLCEECHSSATDHHSPTHTFTIIQRPTCGQRLFRQHLRQMMKNEEMKQTEEGVEKVEMKNEDKTNESSPKVEIEEREKLIKEDQLRLINENGKEIMEHLEHKKEEIKQSESNDQVKKK